MVSGFGTEGKGSIQDATKDLHSECCVRAHNFRGGECPVVAQQQLTVLTLSETYKIVEEEMVGAAIFGKEVEIELPLLKNWPTSQE